MAAGMIILPQYMPARDRSGRLVSGARLTVYANRTTTKATIYADAALTTPLANPVVANSSGQFASIWTEAGTVDVPSLYTLAVSGASGESIGNPAVFHDWQPSLDADTASAVIALNAADRAEDALNQIEDIAAGSPDAPSILNKANKALETNATFKRGGSGAVTTPVLSWINRFYYPEDFGAVGDDVHDDGPAFQACVNAMMAAGGGRMVLSPAKAYLLFNTVVVNMSAVTRLYGDRFEIVGTASTTVRSALTNSPLFDVIGGAWGTLGAAPNVLFSSFVIRGGDPRPSIGRTGVRLTRCVSFTFDRMVFMENHQDVKLIDTLAGKFTTCSFNFSNRGVDGEASTADPNGGSSPNEIVFDDCHWINIRNRPVRLDNASQAVFIGGSFEGTGQALSSIVDDGPVYSIELPRAGTYGNAGMSQIGVHFENCRGEAHYRIVQGIEAATYNITGTDWTNQSATNYVNHVVSFVRGTGQAYFNFSGVGHNSSGGYVPSSSRNFWDQTGTGLDAFCNDLGGSFWGIPTERPYFAGRIYQEQVTGGARQTATAPSPGLVALETGHATSRRAGIAIGSGWVLGQDFDTNGQKTFYLFNLNPGALNTIPLFIEQNGRLRLPGLPTSAAGLNAGTLWNDAGTVKVV